MIQTISSFTLRRPPQNGPGLYEQRATYKDNIYKLINPFNDLSLPFSLQRLLQQFRQWRPQSPPLSPRRTLLGAHYPWNRSLPQVAATRRKILVIPRPTSQDWPPKRIPIWQSIRDGTPSFLKIRHCTCSPLQASSTIQKSASCPIHKRLQQSQWSAAPAMSQIMKT